MAVLRIDHPDIEEFITCKNNKDQLTRYNISVGVTDEFMHCLKHDKPFALHFGGRGYRHVNAKNLWDKIMRSTWDWAEPGILFLDTINKWNNLWYCETIAATNPCGEQPLPPFGACLLGSFNLPAYVELRPNKPFFNYEAFQKDIVTAVRMLDNVIDRTNYPLPEQAKEAALKRRMGLGVTGMANTLELFGNAYGSPAYIVQQSRILKVLRDTAYRASIALARERGSFKLFTSEYLQGKFIKTLPQDIQKDIGLYGIRNSHLISMAPTGTISLTADNVSSSIEPPFSLSYDRAVQTEDGAVVITMEDYAYREWGISGKTSDQLSVDAHLAVQAAAQKYTDSAVSKTINVGDSVTWEEFKHIYMSAWELGCKGCTTFRAAGKRYGVLNKKETSTGEACYIDKSTGMKECG